MEQHLPVYKDNDGSIIYRASALGMCSKALASIRMGYDTEPPPSWLMERFSQGNEYEDKLVTELTNRNYGQSISIGIQVRISIQISTNPDIYVIGHADLVYYFNDNGPDKPPTHIELRDIKALAPSTETIIKRDPFPIYKWQLSSYYWGLKLKYPNTPIDTSFLIIPKSTDDIDINLSARYDHDWRSDRPYFTLDEIRQRVLGIEELAEPGIPPEDCEYPYFPCPVYYLHEGTDRGVINNTPELDELTSQWYELKNAEERIVAQRKELGDRILKLMEDNNFNSINTTAGPLQIVRKTNRRLNKKMLQDDGIDISMYQMESFSSYIKR